MLKGAFFLAGVTGSRGVCNIFLFLGLTWTSKLTAAESRWPVLAICNWRLKHLKWEECNHKQWVLVCLRLCWAVSSSPEQKVVFQTILSCILSHLASSYSGHESIYGILLELSDYINLSNNTCLIKKNWLMYALRALRSWPTDRFVDAVTLIHISTS